MYVYTVYAAAFKITQWGILSTELEPQMLYNIMTKLFFNFEVVFVWTYDISQVKDGIFQNFTVIPGYAK